MATYFSHVGDTTNLDVNITDNDDPWDATGAVITYYLRRPGHLGTVLTRSGALTINGSSTVVPRARYTTLTTDLDVPGAWIFEVRVSAGGSQVWTSDAMRLDVAPKIGP